jgi:hypothetical protein
VFNYPQVAEVRNCAGKKLCQHKGAMKQIFVVRYYELIAVTSFLWSWLQKMLSFCINVEPLGISYFFYIMNFVLKV